MLVALQDFAYTVEEESSTDLALCTSVRNWQWWPAELAQP